MGNCARGYIIVIYDAVKSEKRAHFRHPVHIALTGQELPPIPYRAMSLPLSFKRGSKMSVLKDSVVLQIGRFISRHWYVAKDCGVPRPWINEQRNCGSNEHKSQHGQGLHPSDHDEDKSIHAFGNRGKSPSFNDKRSQVLADRQGH